MARQILDSELLELIDSTNGEFMKNQSEQNTAPAEWTHNQINSHEEEMTQSTQPIQELHEDTTRKTKSNTRNTRQTLRQLDRKLDRIQQDLTQVNRAQQTHETFSNSRQLAWSQPPRKHALTYVLTPSAAQVLFRILDPVFIQWQHMDQSIIVKTPRRYVARSVWRNLRGQTQITQPPACTRDHANFLHIPGFNIIQTTGVKFHFTPARMYCDVLVEGSVIVNDGIKMHLSRLAMIQKPFFLKAFISVVYMYRPTFM